MQTLPFTKVKDRLMWWGSSGAPAGLDLITLPILRTPRIFISAVALASVSSASLLLGAGAAVAAQTNESLSSLSVSLLSPHAGNVSGASFSYISTSAWGNTNVVLTLPGWNALNPIANTGQSPCPASVLVTAKTAPGGGAATFSECTWTQSNGSATFSVVVGSKTGLRGPVTIALSQGMLKNPVAPSSYSVRLSEQSDVGWTTLSQWTSIDMPSDFTLKLASPAPGILTPATATYVSASGWADTNVILTLPGWSAQNTFASTGTSPCPSSITVSVTPKTATVSRCSWTQAPDSAVFSVIVSSPNEGLAGALTIGFGDGMLRNPITPAQYMARISEQSSAGWNSLNWWVNVGVPVGLRAELSSYRQGAKSGAVITYDSASEWVGTNVSLMFPGWTALKTFTSTGNRPCPPSVQVIATPPSATTSQCSWTQGNDSAQLNVVVNSPGIGLQGPLRIVLGNELLGNPDTAGNSTIRLMEQSAAGWIGLSTSVTLHTS